MVSGTCEHIILFPCPFPSSTPANFPPSVVQYRTDFNASYIKVLFRHCKLEHTISNGVLTSRLHASRRPSEQQPAARPNPSVQQQLTALQAQTPSINSQVEAHVRSLSAQQRIYALEAQRRAAQSQPTSLQPHASVHLTPQIMNQFQQAAVISPAQQPNHVPPQNTPSPSQHLPAATQFATQASRPQPTQSIPQSGAWSTTPLAAHAPPHPSVVIPLNNSAVQTPTSQPPQSTVNNVGSPAPAPPVSVAFVQTEPPRPANPVKAASSSPAANLPPTTSSANPVNSTPPEPVSKNLVPSNVTNTGKQNTAQARRASLPPQPVISKKGNSQAAAARRSMSPLHKTTACEITAPVRKVAERTQQLMFSSTNIFFADAAFQVPTTVDEAMEIMRKGTHDVDKASNRKQDDLYFMSWSHTQFFAAQMAALGFRFLSSNLKKKAVQTTPPRVEDWLRLERYHTVPRRLSQAETPLKSPAPVPSSTNSKLPASSTPQSNTAPDKPLTSEPPPTPTPAATQDETTSGAEKTKPKQANPSVSKVATPPPKPIPPQQVPPESRRNNDVTIIDLT